MWTHDDVEDWINVDKGIVLSRAVADMALIDAVMNPNPDRKSLEKASKDEQTVTENISWTKAADGYSTPQKFAESRPC